MSYRTCCMEGRAASQKAWATHRLPGHRWCVFAGLEGLVPQADAKPRRYLEREGAQLECQVIEERRERPERRTETWPWLLELIMDECFTNCYPTSGLFCPGALASAAGACQRRDHHRVGPLLASVPLQEAEGAELCQGSRGRGRGEDTLLTHALRGGPLQRKGVRAGAAAQRLPAATSLTQHRAESRRERILSGSLRSVLDF